MRCSVMFRLMLHAHCADRSAYDIKLPRMQTAPHTLAIHKHHMWIVLRNAAWLVEPACFESLDHVLCKSNVIGALATFRLKDWDGTVHECVLTSRVTLAGTTIKSLERCLSRAASQQITKIWSTMFPTIFTGGEWLRAPATKALR